MVPPNPFVVSGLLGGYREDIGTEGLLKKPLITLSFS
jgi:hypothetical protein